MGARREAGPNPGLIDCRDRPRRARPPNPAEPAHAKSACQASIHAALAAASRHRPATEETPRLVSGPSAPPQRVDGRNRRVALDLARPCRMALDVPSPRFCDAPSQTPVAHQIRSTGADASRACRHLQTSSPAHPMPRAVPAWISRLDAAKAETDPSITQARATPWSATPITSRRSKRQSPVFRATCRRYCIPIMLTRSRRPTAR
jgi:hypothetical protein